MTRIFFKTSTKGRRGFTLLELAIVMGVASIILGGIWAAASQTTENARQQTLKTNMVTIVKNVRAYAASQNGITGDTATLTVALDTLTPPAIPGDMLRALGVGDCTYTMCADHPWGAKTNTGGKHGTLLLCGWDPSATACTTTTSQFFAIQLNELPLASCIKAAPNNSAVDAPAGLFDVVINGTSIISGAGVTNQLPVKVADAKTLCSNATPATINFVYRTATPLY